MYDWNYANTGNYFITIVTHGRSRLFGKIEDGKVVLNDIGKIVQEQLLKSFEIRNELFLGEFIIMPNHLHAIIILQYNDYYSAGTHEHLIETHGRASLQRQPKSISSFVAGFKSTTIQRIDDWIDTNGKRIKKFNKNNPLWQANYYDHVIRNNKEYRMIADYIVNNPINWAEDELMSETI